MKRINPFYLIFIFTCIIINAQSITSQSFKVDGDGATFYPVVFTETNWNDGATEFELSRSNVHEDTEWRGALIAKFRIHTIRWGHMSNFIDADIRYSVSSFIADWKDASYADPDSKIIVWLRGQTTYHFRSLNSSMTLPTVYIGGYQEVNGSMQLPKTEVNTNVNQNGSSINGDSYVNGKGVFNGNVGIGTTTPVANSRLDIQGGGLNIGGSLNLDASLHIKTSFGGFDRLTQIEPSLPNKPALNLMGSSDASGNKIWWSWGVLNTGVWAFQPNYAFGGETGLFIDRTGNVLIGKTTQANTVYKLDVAGKIRADEIVVNTTGADFVFATTYNLRSLSEVESFIKQNQHLPEVASAAEMQKNGVSLSEMQTKLLQKVEELTLYSIEQEIQNNELKKKLAEQDLKYEKLMKIVENLEKFNIK